MKACKKCKLKKTLDHFPPCVRARDGTTGECKSCRNARCNASRELRALTVPAAEAKVCTSCALLRPINDFGRQASQRDGYRNVCRSCFSKIPCRKPEARQQARSLEAQRRGKVYRTLCEWRYHQKACRHARRESVSRSKPTKSNIITEHPDRELARRYRNLLYRTYTYPRTLGYQRLRVRKYKNTHPEKVALWSDRRWQRIADQHDHSVSPMALDELYGRATQCPYCGKSLLTDDHRSLDHMDPIARGGVHGLSNLVVCCRPCNQSKGDKRFAVWLMSLHDPWRTHAEALYTSLHGTAPV